MKDALQKAGYKATPARLRILDALSAVHTPLTPEELTFALNRQSNKKAINVVTVYRTLTLLHNEGMVQKTDLRKGAACFELSKNHHHHITCTFCGTVEDFESISVERELKKIAATTSHFRQIKDHSLELFGVCNSCTTK